jgi:vacuolar-type H+-ATPase subunit H
VAEEKLNQLVEQARLFASKTTQEAEETARRIVAEEKLNQLVEQARLFASKTTQEAEETARRIVAEARAEAVSIVAEAKRAASSITASPGESGPQPDPLVQLGGTIDWFQEINANLVAEISDLRTLIGDSRRTEPPATPLSETATQGAYPPPRFNGENR